MNRLAVSSSPLSRAAVRRWQRRVDLNTVVLEARVPLWVGALLAATYRVLIRSHSLPVALGLLAVALGVCLLRLRSRRCDVRWATAQVDRAVNAGGLLMTELERPLGDWSPLLTPMVPRMLPPRILWGPLSTSLTALAFAGWMMTVSIPDPIPPRPNIAATARLEDLKTQLDALRNDPALDRSLEAELVRLTQEVQRGEFGAADWEAADSMESKLQQEAADASQKLARAAEAARALESALQQGAQSEQAARARETLERALTDLTGAKPSSAQSGQPGSDGQKGVPGQSPAGAEQLRQQLQQRQEALAKAFGQKGTGPKGTGQQAEPGPPPDGSQPGDGTRTPGASTPGGEAGALRFQGPEAEDPAGLAFQPLPGGKNGTPDQIWGMAAVDARKPHLKTGSGQGAAAGLDTTPAHAADDLLPAHRDLVRRYFAGGESGNGR